MQSTKALHKRTQIHPYSPTHSVANLLTHSLTHSLTMQLIFVPTSNDSTILFLHHGSPIAVLVEKNFAETVPAWGMCVVVRAHGCLRDDDGYSSICSSEIFWRRHPAVGLYMPFLYTRTSRFVCNRLCTSTHTVGHLDCHRHFLESPCVHGIACVVYMNLYVHAHICIST